MATHATHQNMVFTADETPRIQDLKMKEMFNDSKVWPVDFANFYGHTPIRVDRRFNIVLSDLSYLPKFNDPRADWVIAAALKAFQTYQSGGFGQVRSFATCGTGSGTDVIAALETFPDLESVALTDLHHDVVETAKRNVLAATEKSENRIRHIAENILAAAGDVLAPLRGQEPFDLIYENLPNIPLASAGDLGKGQTSSTYVGDRSADQIPPHVSAALLDLHYVCLRQAAELKLIKPSGAVLSSMGGRIPLETMLQLADAANYHGSIISFSWKVQSEPEAVIGGYAEHQKRGLRQFYFYPVETLERVFDGRSPAAAGLRAFQIENELLPERLDAASALEQHHAGVEIGHTVAVMASTLKNI